MICLFSSFFTQISDIRGARTGHLKSAGGLWVEQHWSKLSSSIPIYLILDLEKLKSLLSVNISVCVHFWTRDAMAFLTERMLNVHWNVVNKAHLLTNIDNLSYL